MRKHRFYRMVAAAVVALSLVACGTVAGAADASAAQTKEAAIVREKAEAPTSEGQVSEMGNTDKEVEDMIRVRIGSTEVSVTWEDNESVDALAKLAADGPLSVQMSRYGGFEQVGKLGVTLPSNDAQTTTEAGDIVLYAGNQIVVFYGSNSWAYTRLGHITDRTASEMGKLLGSEDVVVTISVK